MSARRISVVVPTRDRPAFLRQALESIRALEGEDIAFEILVGDNGAAPETAEVCKAFDAQHFKVTRNGAGAARNVALQAANGDYIAFLDDDDVWMPGNIRAQLAVLDARPDLEGALGQVVCTDQELRPIMEAWPGKSPGEGDELVRTMLSGYYPQIGATLIRASARDVGAFDESLLGDQDWDWQLRLARRRKLGFAATHCVLFRQRPPGSFDKLRLIRLRFARRVFFRHALAEWKIWGSLGRLQHAHMQALWQYFAYFSDAAIERARAGDMRAARQAIAGAWRVFPLRTVFHLIGPRPLRGAAALAFGLKRRPFVNEAARPIDG